MTEQERAHALNLIYRHTSKDYKGKFADGERSILVLRTAGTCLVALTDLTEQEIASKLPYAQKKEAERLAKKAAR